VFNHYIEWLEVAASNELAVRVL